MTKTIKEKKEETPEKSQSDATIDLRDVFEETTDTQPVPHPLAIQKEEAPKEVKPIYHKETDTNLSFEERIEAFIESRGQSQYIQLNDFLKSLYGVPTFNTPPKWQNLSSMKQLNGILEKMQTEGKIQIEHNKHKILGKHYYEGLQQTQSHHNLNTVAIRAKK